MLTTPVFAGLSRPGCRSVPRAAAGKWNRRCDAARHRHPVPYRGPSIWFCNIPQRDAGLKGSCGALKFGGIPAFAREGVDLAPAGGDSNQLLRLSSFGRRDL